MKIKTEVEFESFSDGVCEIYTEDEEGNKTVKYQSLGFGNRILGYNRHFAAKAVQIQTNAVIRIPKVNGIDIHDTVVIQGIGRYDIEMTQNMFNTNPPSLDLTLRQLEMYEVEQ